MKNFNQLTEKQMQHVSGGLFGSIMILITTCVVAPLGMGAAAGWGINYAVKNK